MLEKYSFSGLKNEVVQKVYDSIDQFYNLYGNRPKKILLGYGTYLVLIEHLSKGVTAPSTIKSSEFMGCKIIIDPGYEFRVTPLYLGNDYDQAIQSVTKNL